MNPDNITKAKTSVKYGIHKNTKPLLVVLMGLPGTGKSYLSDHLHEKYSFTVLSGENITHAIFGTEKCSGAQYKEAYEILRFLAAELLKQNHSVVIDGTNLKYSFRKQIYESAGAGIKKLLIYLLSDDAVALKRANARGENYGDSKKILSKCLPETFAAFKQQLELPRQDEQFRQVKSDERLFEKVDVIINSFVNK